MPFAKIIELELKIQDLGFSSIQGGKISNFKNQEKIVIKFHKPLFKAHKWKKDIKRYILMLCTLYSVLYTS